MFSVSVSTKDKRQSCPDIEIVLHDFVMYCICTVLYSLLCAYLVVLGLNLNFQSLLLFLEIFELILSRLQGLSILGLFHLDGFKLGEK